MTSLRAWGTLVVAALSLPSEGCSRPPPAPPPRAAAPPLGPHENVLWGVSEMILAEELHAQKIQLRVNGHTLQYTRFLDWRGDLPPCPLMLDPGEACALLKIDESPPRPASQVWGTFAFSGDKLFGLRHGGKVGIDQIDERGRATPVAESLFSGSWVRFGLFAPEQGTRVVLAQPEGYLYLSEILPGEPGKPGRLTEPMALPMALTEPDARSARRVAEEMRASPLFGRLHAVALEDEPGVQKPWALVWIEPVAPPFRWPLGKPYRAPAVKKGKNGCGSGGGHASRDLGDASVDKRVHITRFSGVKQTSDVIAWSSNDIKPGQLVVRATPKGVDINGSVFTRDGTRLPAAAAAALPRAPQPSGVVELDQVAAQILAPTKHPQGEQILGAAFDPRAGEGLVLVSQGKVLWSRRFDASGRFLAPADRHAGELPLADGYELTRVKGAWLAVHRQMTAAINLTKPGLSPVVGQPARPLVALLPQDDRVRAFYRLDEKLFAVEMDATGAVVKDPVDARASLSVENLHGVLLSRDAEPKLLHDHPLAAGAGSIHRVWGDLVAFTPSPQGATLSWLRAGEKITVPPSSLVWPGFPEVASGGALGPLERRAAAVLPASPGPPVATPELSGVERECPFALPTGPDTLVLVCRHAPYREVPSVKVTLRAHRRHLPSFPALACGLAFSGRRRSGRPGRGGRGCPGGRRPWRRRRRSRGCRCWR